MEKPPPASVPEDKEGPGAQEGPAEAPPGELIPVHAPPGQPILLLLRYGEYGDAAAAAIAMPTSVGALAEWYLMETYCASG